MRGDPTQLQNAVLNLALNAWDAMPDGGRLGLRTEKAELLWKSYCHYLRTRDRLSTWCQLPRSSPIASQPLPLLAGDVVAQAQEDLDARVCGVGDRFDRHRRPTFELTSGPRSIGSSASAPGRRSGAPGW